MTPPLEHDYIGIGLGLSDSCSSSSSSSSSSTVSSDLKTELRLGLPGSESPPPLSLSIPTPRGSKRGFSDAIHPSTKWVPGSNPEPASKPHKPNANATQAMAQVVGWPPIRSYRKNTMAANTSPPAKKEEDADAKQGPGCLYVKVRMDGAPYLRKVDLKMCSNYKDLSLALENLFSCFTLAQCGSHGMLARDGQTENKLIDNGSENVLTYEDKDGDWMLVGDVPWDMFVQTCKRLRIMKGSDAIGLAPRATGKIKNQN